MQPRDPRTFLWDVVQAAQEIDDFVRGLDARSYASTAVVTAAVERKFEIIGEALNQLSKAAPELADRIPKLSKIVAFRNQLIHGYSAVAHTVVWNTVQKSLPELLISVTRLLSELDTESK
jgi:uncharacterized protein with HEPN domain